MEDEEIPQAELESLGFDFYLMAHYLGDCLLMRESLLAEEE